MNLSRPSAALGAAQAAWLAPARDRLFRRVDIARRRRLLDLGCGQGDVTRELRARGGGAAWGVDRVLAPHLPGACGDAARLPFRDRVFDLVLTEMALLWMPLEATLAEIDRLLVPGGVLLALEPDYGGLVEYPPEIAVRELWIAALRRAGADPEIGRRLPSALERRGFIVQVALLDELRPPAPERFELLGELELTPAEREAWCRARAVAGPAPLAHLPIFQVIARKPLPNE